MRTLRRPGNIKMGMWTLHRWLLQGAAWAWRTCLAALEGAAKVVLGGIGRGAEGVMPRAPASLIFLCSLHCYENARPGVISLHVMRGHSKHGRRKSKGLARNEQAHQVLLNLRQPGHESTTCLDRRDIPKKPRKQLMCTSCGVGGHQRNTCDSPSAVYFTKCRRLS